MPSDRSFFKTTYTVVVLNSGGDRHLKLYEPRDNLRADGGRRGRRLEQALCVHL